MILGHHGTRLLGILGLAFVAGTLPGTANADLFRSGWTLDSAASNLSFEVVHNRTTAETYTLSSVEGGIDADGTATLSVDLESIDTQNDLRDTRMRYVLFETFKFPKATISAKFDERTLAALDDLPTYLLDLDVTLELHGVRRSVSAQAIATMLDDETVSIVSTEPVLLKAKDFGFTSGFEKLQQAYFGAASPYAAVSFKFVFEALPHVDKPAAVAQVAASTEEQIINGRSTAIEPKERCLARLRTLSPAGSLQFRNGSHQLASESLIVLANVAGAIRPCDELRIVVEGHTDAVGDEASNKILSQRRADHVTGYLVLLGLPESRVHGEGYGESRPIAPNDTPENRSRNRRIEFSIHDG